MRSIGLNLVTLKDGQEARLLPENLDRVRGAGFQGVGLWVPTIEEWLRAGRSLAEMREEINCRGLGVDEICAVSVLDQSGKVADRRRIFEWARELGCGRIVSIYGNPNNPLEKAREDWAAFVAQVEDTGVSPAFEFIGPWPRYHSPLEAWQVIQAGPELGSMVFDTFSYHPKALPFTKEKLVALGLGDFNGTVEMLAEALLGLDGVAAIGIREGTTNPDTGEEYPDQNTVRRYYPPGTPLTTGRIPSLD